MARHVRTAAGAAFFKKPIGSVISEAEYQSIVAARSRKGHVAPALPKVSSATTSIASDLRAHAKALGSHPAANRLSKAADALDAGNSKLAYDRMNAASGTFLKAHPTSGVQIADEANPHRKRIVGHMRALQSAGEGRAPQKTMRSRYSGAAFPLNDTGRSDTHTDASAVPSGGDDHSKLLEARRQARAKFPVGHPERLAAERAVRQSRKSDEYRGTKTPGSSAEPETTKSDAPTYSPSEQHYSGGLPKDERDVYDAARRNGKDHAEAVKQVVRYRGGNPRFADRATKMRESAAQQRDHEKKVADTREAEHESGQGSDFQPRKAGAPVPYGSREHTQRQVEEQQKREVGSLTPEQQEAYRQARAFGATTGVGHPEAMRRAKKVGPKQSSLVSPEDIVHSTASVHTDTVGPRNLKEVRRGVQTTTRKVIRSTLRHGDKHVGLVTTSPGGGGELEIGNRTQYLNGSYGPGGLVTNMSQAHSGNVSQAKDYAAAEINARKVRAALTASGHSAARSSTTAVKGWRDFYAGHQVSAGRGGVGIEHQLSSGAMRQGEESAKKRSDALQKYMAALEARGIIAVPQRDANGNITSLHVPHPKKGG